MTDAIDRKAVTAISTINPTAIPMIFRRMDRLIMFRPHQGASRNCSIFGRWCQAGLNSVSKINGATLALRADWIARRLGRTTRADDGTAESCGRYWTTGQ